MIVPEKITFGSICSGIEAASVAWLPLGFKCSWLSEIDKFPSAVLAHHYPDTKNLGDMTKISGMVKSGIVDAPDILIGGTPCQSFSVAGMRKGLSDERGALTIKFVELADAIDDIRCSAGFGESIIVWENVPGVLSSKDNAFGCFLAALAGEDEELIPSGKRWTNAGCVFGSKRTVAWRLLDAQYFGVAQRRRRLFVIASSRDGFCPAKVLFEFDGVRRDSAPSRETRKEAAGNARESFTSTSFGGYSEGVGTLRASGGDLGGGSEALVAFGIPGNWICRKPENGGNSTQFMHEIAPNQKATDKHGVIAFNSRQYPVSGDLFGSLDSSGQQAQAIAIGAFKGGQGSSAGGIGFSEHTSPTLTSAESGSNRTPTLLQNTAVRRLTPIECERLQGFPDNYTQIPWKAGYWTADIASPETLAALAEQCPDGHRYKALGNSMAVTVIRWIGERISKNLSQTIGS